MARPPRIRDSVARTAGSVARTTGNIDALIREIMDGSTITFVRIGDKPVMQSFLDFWTGKQEEFPLGIKIKVKE